MPKGPARSSASSATRKKHQRKAAVALGIEVDVNAAPAAASSQSQGPTKPKNKGKSGSGRRDGLKKKSLEPKVKAYIPPVKPARAQPDPLEVGGLARRLPPELVVVLRNVGKKAQVTKIRALEELGSGWVERALVRRRRWRGARRWRIQIRVYAEWVHNSTLDETENRVL